MHFTALQTNIYIYIQLFVVFVPVTPGEWSLRARFKVPAGPCGWVYVPVFGEAGGLDVAYDMWHQTLNGQLTTRQWSSICFTRNRGCLVESWKGRKKVWISKYRWTKNLAPVGMVARSGNTVIIHTMYMIYGLLWFQLLQEFCSSTYHHGSHSILMPLLYPHHRISVPAGFLWHVSLQSAPTSLLLTCNLQRLS